MSEHLSDNLAPAEQLTLGDRARTLGRVAAAVGVAGLLLSLLLGYIDDHTLRRFLFSYLVSFSYFLSIALGALIFVLLQHATRAGWSVSVRRLAEILATTLPVLALLSAPIIISLLTRSGDLYPWARPIPASVQVENHAAPEAASAPRSNHAQEELTEALQAKRPYLNIPFFLARLLVYFGLWSFLALWYWRCSILQDRGGDPALTSRMQGLASPALVGVGLTLTLAAFDLVMSLDPLWYSTIFGVYYFAGCAVGIFATLILLANLLQRAGLLRQSITPEHLHDLGKFLFGFVFFWGYIAFSQYMLIWYGNIPEETAWLRLRGATTVSADVNGWTAVALMLLFGHLLLPFAGLISRTVKRNRSALLFWAVWLLVFHWFDLYWLIMPQLGRGVRLGLVELGAFLGIGGIFLASALRAASRVPLRPTRDPRLEESLAFENV